MDRMLREEIVAEVQKAVEVAMVKAGERWITADELCKQFQMFTKDWLENYGDILPRKQIRIECTISGKKRGTRWGYAKLEIAENIRNGVYDDIKLLR